MLIHDKLLEVNLLVTPRQQAIQVESLCTVKPGTSVKVGKVAGADHVSSDHMCLHTLCRGRSLPGNPPCISVSQGSAHCVKYLKGILF